MFVEFNLDEEELDELAKIFEDSKELVDMVKQVNREYHSIFTVREDEIRIHNTLMEGVKNDGIKLGIEQGTQEAKLEMIKNMLQNNFTIEQIKLATNESKERILEIKKEVLCKKYYNIKKRTD